MSFPTAPTTHHQTFYGNKPPQDGPFYAPSLGYHQTVRNYLDYLNSVSSARSFDVYSNISSGNILPSPFRRKLLNSAISGLSDDGILSQLDALWFLATDGSVSSAFTNILSPSLYTCSFHNPGGNLISKQSFGGVYGFLNGSVNSVMGVNTGFNPATNGVNMTQDSNSVFCFLDLTNSYGSGGTGLNGELFGNSDASAGFVFSFFGNYRWRQNDNPATSITNPMRKATTFIHLNRTSSSVKNAYFNGVLVNQTSSTSISFASAQMTIGKNLSAGQIVNSTFGVFGVGASLAGLEDKLNYRIQKYMAGVI